MFLVSGFFFSFLCIGGIGWREGCTILAGDLGVERGVVDWWCWLCYAMAVSVLGGRFKWIMVVPGVLVVPICISSYLYY